MDEAEIPDGATAQNLFALLKISEPQGAVVAMEGRILKADDKIRCGVPVNVLQAIHRGYASQVHEGVISAQ